MKADRLRLLLALTVVVIGGRLPRCVDAVLGSCPPSFVSQRDLADDRTACTAACNTHGYCCTTNSGGCQKLTCTAGCHIAWHTPTEEACVAECSRGNSAGTCDFTYTDGTQFQNCFGHVECGCPADGGGNDWGTANDCSASACAAGCRLAANASGAAFYGRALTAGEMAAKEAAQSSNGAALDAALVALRNHVDGTDTLSNTDLPTKAAIVKQHGSLLKQGGSYLTKAFDLVSAYEASSSGPLPFPFPRTGSNDGHDLSRAMLVVMQTLLDEVYNSGDQGTTTVFAPCSRSVFEGKTWQTSARYPGAAPPPADPTVVHSVHVYATLEPFWGAFVARRTSPSRKPLGLYLSPGFVAEVNVPLSMVDKDFKVLVSGQTPDNSIKNEHRRLDRVTVTVPITNASTLVSSPLGGSLYLLVPYQASLGLQTIQVTGKVVQSPLFQASRSRTMTNDEWKAVRTAPGPWADFETDKTMLTVPRSWVYAMDDPASLMATYDKAMDGVAEMFGFPVSRRNRQLLYLMPDLHIEHPAYGTGYPQVNTLIDAGALASPLPGSYTGRSDHWLVTNPTGWPVCYHELGHSQQEQQSWFQYRGETEAIVNFVWTYVRHVKFGDTFNAAFQGSMDHSNYEPDDAAVHWMITPNFRAGKEMDRSHTELDEFRYQHRGYARYADIVRLFGWQAWTGYYHKRNVAWNDVTWLSRASWLDGLDGVDRRTLEFSIQANCDLTALIHFWGIHPVDATALSAKMTANNLTACKEVLCLLKRYRTLIPRDNAEFNTFFEKIHPGRPIVSSDDPRYGRGWYNVWRDAYGTAEGAAAVAQLDTIIDTYFPGDGNVVCSDQITATSDVARPCKYSWLPEGSPTTFGCNIGRTPTPAPAFIVAVDQATASTPAPTPAPLVKAPTDTKHFVEVDVTMPYTVDQFNTAAVMTSFKKAVATAAGTDPENVIIVSVTVARRRSSSVVVQTKILAKDAAAVATMKSTLGSGDALKTKLNTALKKEGLKESTGVTAPVTGTSAAARSVAATALSAKMLITMLSLAVCVRM